MVLKEYNKNEKRKSVFKNSCKMKTFQKKQNFKLRKNNKNVTKINSSRYIREQRTIILEYDLR